MSTLETAAHTAHLHNSSGLGLLVLPSDSEHSALSLSLDDDRLTLVESDLCEILARLDALGWGWDSIGGEDYPEAVGETPEGRPVVGLRRLDYQHTGDLVGEALAVANLFAAAGLALAAVSA